MVVMYYRPKELRKIVMSRIADAPELPATAEKVKRTAEILAASHYNTGAFSASLTIRPRVSGKAAGRGIDWEVVATDPHAHHIEWGHELAGVPPKTAKGAVPSGRVGKTGKKWVQGLHILRNAALANGGFVGRG